MLIDDAVKREDLAALDTIHTFACRYGDAESNGTISTLVGEVLIQKVWEAASNNWPQPLTAEQNKALGELKLEIDNVHSAIRGTRSASTWPFGNSTLPAITQMKPVEIAQLLLGGGRSLNAMMVESMNDDTLAEQQALGGPIHKLFEKIETFDYTTFSWGES
jgi:hypothetical protein